MSTQIGRAIGKDIVAVTASVSGKKEADVKKDLANPKPMPGGGEGVEYQKDKSTFQLEKYPSTFGLNPPSELRVNTRVPTAGGAEANVNTAFHDRNGDGKIDSAMDKDLGGTHLVIDEDFNGKADAKIDLVMASGTAKYDTNDDGRYDVQYSVHVTDDGAIHKWNPTQIDEAVES
jgi:hypothetical protein